ncbi:TPA: hypothetical protein U1X39_002422 [Streptococcus suis]|nr:hypothetical protein [Streptococcus suis]
MKILLKDKYFRSLLVGLGAGVITGTLGVNALMYYLVFYIVGLSLTKFVMK